MRSKNIRRTAAALVLLGAPTTAFAAADTVSYVNLLQFDLASFRSQATAGIHDDDIERVANATRLLEIDGNRLFTSFANLSRPATLGDNLVTYGLDHRGDPGSAELFDTGSYLVGWIGKIDLESEYVFSVFYQRNHDRGMFEDLEDGGLGGSFGGGDFEAEHTGATILPTDVGTGGNPAGDGDPDAESSRQWDLTRWDDRSAMNFDLGVARELSADLAVGGRIMWERDVLDRFAHGTAEWTDRQKLVPDGPLVTTNHTAIEYRGDDETAYENRELGLSLNADFHPWAERSVSLRLDLFSSRLVNPASGGTAGALDVAREMSAPAPRDPAGYGVNFWERTVTTRTPVDGGLALTTLTAEREKVEVATGSYQLDGSGAGLPATLDAVHSISDERDALGLAGLAEYVSAFGGGDSRSWVGFSRRPFDLDSRVVRRGYTRSREWWNVDGQDYRTTAGDDSTETTDRRGDVTVSALEVGTRWNREMNRTVSVGCGVILTRQSDSADYERTTTLETRSEFDDGHPDANRLDDLAASPGAFDEFVAVTTTTFRARYDRQMKTSTIRLPVGVQFRWGEGGRFGWNMGAMHGITSRKIEETEVIPVENGRRVLVETFAAHPVDDSTVESDASLASSRGTRTERDRWNTTAYFYGFEWHITDAAQLNVNGLFDSHSEATSGEGQITDVDFYRNLSVSLTFAFL